jgi:prophage regulatory protein
MTFITLEEVKRVTTLSRSAIYARMRKCTFPRPVPTGERSRAWVFEEVALWIKRQIDCRDDVNSTASASSSSRQLSSFHPEPQGAEPGLTSETNDNQLQHCDNNKNRDDNEQPE